MASIRMKRNKDGSLAYVVRVYARRDQNGKAKYLSKTYTPAPGTGRHKIEKRLQELCAELERKAKSTGSLTAGQTFESYANHFLRAKQLTCSEYTLQSYRIALEKACCYLGHIPLEQLTAKHLEHLTYCLYAGKSQYHKPYSAAYIRHIQTLVRMTLAFAVKEGVLEVNPADKNRYTLIRREYREPVFLELEEAKQYVLAAQEEPDLKLRTMVLLFLYTGIRMEELCGLEWRDIDFAGKEICIRRASVYIPGSGVITKQPKSRSGSRILCADPIVFQALAAYLEQKKHIAGFSGESRLFTRKDGGILIPGTTAIWLKRFAKKHGLRTVTPHKLRHTYATLQIAYGTDIRTVAGMMGHSSPMTTLTIYAHQIREASKKAALAMSDMLTPKYPQKNE